MSVVVRPARTQDVRAIRDLVDIYSPDGRLLSKATVTLFEDIQEFLVAEEDGEVVGCGALHVMWEDLAEVGRRIAVAECADGSGSGSGSTSGVLPDIRNGFFWTSRVRGDRGGTG